LTRSAGRMLLRCCRRGRCRCWCGRRGSRPSCWGRGRRGR
jgi:hypothetical protein